MVDFGVQCCDIDSTLERSEIKTPPHTPKKDVHFETPQKEDDDNIILDISSIFDFLQDPDFDTETLPEDNATGFYTDKRPYSTSSSSSNSLDLEIYGKDAHLVWKTADDGNGVPSGSLSSSTTSHCVSDIDDSESTDASSSSGVDGDGTNKVTLTNP